jgi:hypothetical protein
MEWKYFENKRSGAELLSANEEDDCYYDFVPSFVEENGYLPIECRECYKALIFWTYSKVNIAKFKKMIKALPVSIHGKYNESVAVIYFKDRAKMLRFLNILQERMKQFGVDGRIQWRVSGKYWQDAYPHFFKSAKELNSISSSSQITMKEWLKQKGILTDT